MRGHNNYKEMQECLDRNNASIARQMFEDLGYECCLPIQKDDSMTTIHKDNAVCFMIDANFKDIECMKQYQSITPELLSAFYQLFKEFGWVK